MKKTVTKCPCRSASLLKQRRKQRILIREQLFLLAIFMEEWYWQNKEMKNNEEYEQYAEYEGHDPYYYIGGRKYRHHILRGNPIND